MASDDCDKLFDCTLCGECCKGFGGTYLTEADVTAIAAHIGVSRQRLLADYTSPSGSRRVLAMGENGYCVFWDRVCTIHAVKPRMCRQWPYIENVLVDVANWRAMAGSCPGIHAEAPEQEILRCVRRKLKG